MSILGKGISHNASNGSALNQNGRYYSLDALRAIMMLLGLVLHSFISYGAIDYDTSWPYQDAQTNSVFDVIVFSIHIFRMPIFYFMAGFFAAMLYERRQPSGMAFNRASRILIPFILSWIVIYPPISFGFNFANVARDSSIFVGLQDTYGLFLSNIFNYRDSTAHLWFLYYLLMYYLVFLAIVPMLRRLPLNLRSGFLNGFSKVITSRFRAIWFAIPTALTLWITPLGSYETSTSFIPSFRTFTAYIVFFSFGWLLYQKREILSTFKQYAWTQVILGALLSVPNHIAAIYQKGIAPDTRLGVFSLVVISGSLIVWLFAFGITGLFLRYLNYPNRLIRYIVDASYWLYLIHLPLTIWLPGFLTGVQWPAPVKAMVVLLLTTFTGLVTYNYLVRTSYIGKTLNGRKYPRGLPSFSNA